jgi:hypothetical protein
MTPTATAQKTSIIGSIQNQLTVLKPHIIAVLLAPVASNRDF